MWILFMLIWGGCGLLTYGVSLAYFQREFPELAEEDAWKDCLFSVYLAIHGPVGLLFIYVISKGFRHGVHWRIAVRKKG